jgi:transposase
LGLQAGHVIVKKRLARQKVLPFVALLPPWLVGIEASGRAYYWARGFTILGHTVKLMSPQFVKRICSTRKMIPTMRQASTRPSGVRYENLRE